ncbi:MAG: DUF2877 domain-containing protein [Anaerolineae bacterium]|nr:DUF2877 domain-containing protein [Anaerolineae bacterium]
MPITTSSVRLVSISSLIAPVLTEPAFAARVESVFADAVNLRTQAGHYVALVSQRVGNGPINAVVEPPFLLAVLRPGDQVRGDGRRLRLGHGWELDLHAAEVWDPRPDYERLARWPQVLRANLRRLRSEVPLEAPPSSLAAAPAFHTQGAFGSRPAMALIQSHASELISGLRRAYRAGNLTWIRVFAQRLAGLGPGLTPAGDDWLAGWLVGLRARAALDEEDVPFLPVEVVGDAVLEAAQDQTNDLSLAFLRAAAAGAVTQAWHQLLEALTNADPVALRDAVTEVLSHGGTSGADTLAGFLAAFEDDR